LILARLHADENFNFRVVALLRSCGHDVVTAGQVGRANFKIDDPDVLDDAINLSRSVLTYNVWHFVPLHRARPTHFGIITCTRDDDETSLADRIHHAITRRGSLDGVLIRVTQASPKS